MIGVVVGLSSTWLVAQSSMREIPFDFTTQQPIAAVRVNGAQAVPFIFDTGASINVVGEEIARQAAVEAGGGRNMSGGGQTRVQARFAESLRLAAGDIVWDGQRAAITTISARHYAGFIGAPILMQYAAQFDFEKRVLRLIDPAGYKPPTGAVVVSFELQDDLPVVRVAIDPGNGPIEARLMVDTGASQFIDLNRPFVDEHKLLDVIPDAAALNRPAGIGGSAPFLYGTGRSATLGSIRFDRPRLGLSRAQSGSSSRSERDGIIGNDLLKQFVMTVDYKTRTIVLEKPTTPPQ